MSDSFILHVRSVYMYGSWTGVLKYSVSCSQNISINNDILDLARPKSQAPGPVVQSPIKLTYKQKFEFYDFAMRFSVYFRVYAPMSMGIHYNPESWQQPPPNTVTLKEQWKHRYLPHTYHAKREGVAGSELSNNYLAMKQTQNDLTSEARSNIMHRPLHITTDHPAAMPR